MLLSIDRRQSPAEALETVLLAEEYSKNTKCPVRVVGIDLSGDPRVRAYDLHRLAAKCFKL